MQSQNQHYIDPVDRLPANFVNVDVICEDHSRRVAHLLLSGDWREEGAERGRVESKVVAWRPRDLWTWLQVPQPAADFHERRLIHDVLASAMMQPEQSVVVLDESWPPKGLSTRHDFLVPWMIERIRAGEMPESVPVGHDIEQPIAVVRDWVIFRGPGVLKGKTWDRAYRIAKQWYDFVHCKWISGGPIESAMTIIRFDDGAHIDRLTMRDEFTAEGLSMSHCLRSALHYFDDALRGDIVLISYRDPKGIPQVTVELNISGERPRLVQFQGPGNGRVKDPLCRSRMAWFLTRWLEIPEESIDAHWLARMGLSRPLATIDSPFPIEEFAPRLTRDPVIDIEVLTELDEVLQGDDRDDDAFLAAESAFLEVLTDGGVLILTMRLRDEHHQQGILRRWELLSTVGMGTVRLTLQRSGEKLQWLSCRDDDSSHVSEGPLEALQAAGVELPTEASELLVESDEEALAAAAMAATADLVNGSVYTTLDPRLLQNENPDWRYT